MRFARDRDNQLVDALQAVQTGSYFCPSCKEAVHLKGGKYRRNHFAHVCAKRLPQQYNNKEHLAIQEELRQWFQYFGYKVLVEQRHDDKGRRADISINQNMLCLEVQCSPITAAEIIARTADYRQIYANVCWLGSSKVLKQVKSNRFQIPAFILQKLYVQEELFFFDVLKKKLIILKNIVRISATTILAEKRVVSKNDNPFQMFTGKKSLSETTYALDRYLLYWQRKLRYKRKYAVMNYQLVSAGIKYERFFSQRYRLPQIHIGLFNWQLMVVYCHFCLGITDANECLLLMEKEKTIASRTEAIVQEITLFMKHLREPE